MTTLFIMLLTFFSCQVKPETAMTTINEQPAKPAQAEEKLALHYLERPAKTESGKRRALILLHGVGSNEQDLFGLAPHLPDDLLILSPRGPLTLGTGRYAWYEVDFSTGKPVFNASQEAQSRELILQFIRQVKQKYKLDEVYLGGFSQGGIMSYSIGLTHPTEVTGIISLSGRLLAEIKPSVKPGPELKNLKVFIAHGTQDGTLPVHYAREASAYLKELGIQPSYHEFEMAHQINNQVLAELVSWLQK